LTMKLGGNSAVSPISPIIGRVGYQVGDFQEKRSSKRMDRVREKGFWRDKVVGASWETS